MIEDIIAKEMNSNPEIVDLLGKMEKLEEEMDDFELNAYNNYKSNIKIIILSLVACIVTLILSLVFHVSVIPTFLCYFVARYSIHVLLSECKEDENKILDMQKKYDLMGNELKEISYAIGDKIVNRLKNIASEAARYIKEGKLDEIINNYDKYSDVAFLLNEKYSCILLLLGRYAKSGIKSIDELSAQDKDILYFMVGCLNNDYVDPVMDFDLDTSFDEEMKDYDNQEIKSNPKTYVKKRPR